MRIALGGALIAIVVSLASDQTAEFTQSNKGRNAVSTQVPLGNHPGRGVSLPVTLQYSSSGLWRIGFINSVYANVYGYQIRRSVTEAIYYHCPKPQCPAPKVPVVLNCRA